MTTLEQMIHQARQRKVEELNQVLGKRVSQNQSPTGTAKLVEVNAEYSIFESLQSEYRQYPDELVGLQYVVPTQYAWNAYFF